MGGEPPPPSQRMRLARCEPGRIEGFEPSVCRTSAIRQLTEADSTALTIVLYPPRIGWSRVRLGSTQKLTCVSGESAAAAAGEIIVARPYRLDIVSETRRPVKQGHCCPPLNRNLGRNQRRPQGRCAHTQTRRVRRARHPRGLPRRGAPRLLSRDACGHRDAQREDEQECGGSNRQFGSATHDRSLL